MDHYEMLRRVSRTFALSIEQLPPRLREPITIAYLLFRVSDYLEDAKTLQAERKAELLTLWARVLDGDCPADTLTDEISNFDEHDPEAYVAKHADVVIKLLNTLHQELRPIIIDHVRNTSLGMARWQEHGPYVADEDDMDDYMHQVAGRVGYLLTDVFSWYSPAIYKLKNKLMPLGQQFGLALQTVNIIRGLRKDYERGWVFVPVTFYNRVGLKREDLFEPAYREKALKVVEMLADKAERHLQQGITYITLLPRFQHHIRLFCIWPLLFAVKTLAISRNNATVLSDEAKISHSHIKQIVYTSRLFYWSNLFLTAYYRHLSKMY